MAGASLAIHQLGLVTAVGGSAPASCAAFRGKVNNPSPTRFMNACGEWIIAHGVETPEGVAGLDRLSLMAVQAAHEALAAVPAAEWPTIALLMCVAERDRPGRMAGLEDTLFEQVQAALGGRFADDSSVIAQGRVSVAVALALGRKLIAARRVQRVLILAVDSLLHWPTVTHFDRVGRLLREDQSNGFMLGEGAGAVLVGLPQAGPQLLCTGMGFAMESAHIDSELPLRADGLSAAIKEAVADAGWQMRDLDYRITDLSGEQYYFKEAALALQRTLHEPKAEFDLWHPAECTGEAGALAGAAILALAEAAGRKGYARGPHVLAHMANDAGPRAALTLQYRRA